MKTREQAGDDADEDTEDAEQQNEEKIDQWLFLLQANVMAWFRKTKDVAEVFCLIEHSCTDRDMVVYGEVHRGGWGIVDDE